MKAFIRGREVFGSPITMNPQGYKHLVDYLFDTRHLTDGAPPNDRGCRFCGKIGHIQKDCPKKKLNIERREKKERQKDRQDLRSAIVESKREEMSKSDTKYLDDNRLRDKPGAESGTKGNAPAGAKRPEDVASGKSTGQPSSKMDHSHKESSRKADHHPHGKSSYIMPSTMASPVVPSNVRTDSMGKSLVSGLDSNKTSVRMAESHSSVRTNNSKNNGPCVSGTTVINGPNASDAGMTVSRVSSTGKGSGSSGLSDAVAKEKAMMGQSEVMGGLSVPPGFHHLRHESQNYSNQAQPVKERASQGISSNHGTSGNNKMSGHVTTLHDTVHQSSNVQHHPIQLEKQQQSHPHHHIAQQKQQQLPQQNYVDGWSHMAPHPYINPKAQDPLKKNLTHQTSTTATSAQNPHQPYCYTISPAALFHMASQAAGGQLSTLLMPNVTESNSNRSGSSIPTSSSLGTPNSSVSGPPPPPGFSAPVTIHYPNQQLDATAMPFNKLVMGSPLYRSPVSQAEGQQVVPSTASQSFMAPIGQPVGGMTGVYALQQSSSGSQFATMNPTGTAHSPQGLNDHSLSQQQVPFDTRQFLSQVPQGLHQGVPQNLASIPPGIPQGVAQALQGAPTAPPGLSTSVPQGVQGVSQGLHQSLVGGVPQVSMGSALSPGIQPVPIGHHLPQHYPQPSFPQQGYQMAMAGPSGYYSDTAFVFGDPSMQNPSPGAQGELITDMTAFQRPDVYETQMSALPQYLASSLPQHQNLLSHNLTNISLAPQHGPPTAAGPGPAYTPTNVIFIEGERDGSQLLQ